MELHIEQGAILDESDIDIGHAEGWLQHVIEPQVAAFPDSRIGIAEGLIARADASLDYFDYCLATARTITA